MLHVYWIQVWNECLNHCNDCKKSILYTWKKCRTAASFTALDFCSFLAGKIETELSLLAEKLKSLSITVKDEKFKVIQYSFFKTIFTS
jgi:hypothetical protein